MSFPALRKHHQSSFTLLKPRSPISSELLPGSQLSDAHVSHRHVVPLSATVQAQFKVFGRNKPGNVSVIIYLTESDLGAYYLIPPASIFDAFPQWTNFNNCISNTQRLALSLKWWYIWNGGKISNTLGLIHWMEILLFSLTKPWHNDNKRQSNCPQLTSHKIQTW